eukprot:GHRR01026930.1.p1 GENE.GHRR01026930.1~~GHRR01026930.1.p1  ORF type:complete len:679 (+),score=281.79 GHRR01026930.1:134-2170(+)
MERQKEDKRKWQRALRPTSTNSSLADRRGTTKPKYKSSDISSGPINDKENIAVRSHLATGKSSNAAAKGRVSSTRLLGFGKDSIGTTRHSAVGKDSIGSAKQSASKLPKPPSSSARITQGQAVVRAFGRAVTQVPKVASTTAKKPPANKPPATVAPARRAAAAPTAITATQSTHSVLARPAVIRQPAAVVDKAAQPAAEQTSAAKSAEPTKRRSSGFSGRQLGMDKLQSEYEALQQKLALLKRDTNRDSKLKQATPLSAAPGRLKAMGAFAAAAGSDVKGPADSSILAGSTPAHLHGTASGTDAGCLGQLPLQSCENLQLQCSGHDSAGVLQSLQTWQHHAGSKFAQLAEGTFTDPEFLQLCEQGLSAQLQRTKDGATAQSRITELAGLVKVLRRCVREMATKSGSYVVQCAKAEKDMQQELQKVRIDAETAEKRLEAEAALARAAAAQTEATYKSERAAWVTSLDAQKFEVARLQREVEGLEEQRARAREEAKRAEQARQQLEQEIKELRKASGQQLREVQVTQGEAVKQLKDKKQQAERKEAQLRTDNEQLEASLAAANSQLAKLKQQVASMMQLQEGLQASLHGKQSAEAALATQLTQVQADLSAAEASLAAAAAERAQLQQELSSSRDQAMLLQNEMRLKTSRLEAIQQQLAAEAAEHEAEKGLLQKQLEQLKV